MQKLAYQKHKNNIRNNKFIRKRVILRYAQDIASEMAGKLYC